MTTTIVKTSIFGHPDSLFFASFLALTIIVYPIVAEHKAKSAVSPSFAVAQCWECDQNQIPLLRKCQNKQKRLGDF